MCSSGALKELGVEGSAFRVLGLGFKGLGFRGLGFRGLGLVAGWIHFALLGIILPTIKLKVYSFWGL